MASVAKTVVKHLFLLGLLAACVIGIYVGIPATAGFVNANEKSFEGGKTTIILGSVGFGVVSILSILVGLWVLYQYYKML